jgi:hypothetical protein
MNEQTSKPHVRQTSGGSGKGRILRLVIWGVVLAFVGLTVWELLARRNAQNTAQAWAEAVGQNLTESQLAEKASGNPSAGDEEFAKAIKDDEAPPLLSPKMKMRPYTWYGILKDYTVIVYYYGLGPDPEIEAVRGPYTGNPEFE